MLHTSRHVPLATKSHSMHRHIVHARSSSLDGSCICVCLLSTVYVPANIFKLLDSDTIEYPERRREPSDVSVEALDLADYAKTLNRRNNDPYPQPAFRAYDPYPPSPRPLRLLASRDSLTPSASASHSRSPAPIRRPFSLPAPTFPSHSFSNHPSVSNHSNSKPAVQGPDAQEIDIGHFPAFTRGWYGNESPQNTTTSPTSFHGHSKNAATPHVSPFDPTFPTHAYDNDLFSAPYPYSPPPSYPYRYGPHPLPRATMAWFPGAMTFPRAISV
ncbi:hypothetical protein A0H81_10759 [Grifola frondosa]|uniref:Uncharacterized protein n=1 Tax=Grifola frondosa TaxID=5627 RepID=A0A1C7M2C8_GRIFR|nr:hypothetical protein A0H81_10759 [Grifola frondosa]